MTRQTFLNVEQLLLVLLDSHGCSSLGRVARTALLIILSDSIGRVTKGARSPVVTLRDLRLRDARNGHPIETSQEFDERRRWFPRVWRMPNGTRIEIEQAD